MENIIWVGVAVLGVVFVAFLWEGARSAYFAIAARWYGWSDEEKFERSVARERRIWAREERSAKRDEIAAGDVVRRRYGVSIATFAMAGLAFQLDLPWWNAGAITVAALVGLTMAAGLSFRW